jgi:hypothetical protein
MEALLLAITGLFNIVCFIIGAKVGQAVSKGERVEMPNLNPMKAIRESRARRDAEQKQDKRDAILRNVERYDGTARGQEDVG